MPWEPTTAANPGDAALGYMLLALVGAWLLSRLVGFLGGVGKRAHAAAPERVQLQHKASEYEAPANSAPMASSEPDFTQFVGGGNGAVWMRDFNDIPNVNPHVAACGPSGSGKSTLVLAALKQRKGGIVICTPKPPSQDPWGGFPVVRLKYTDDGASWANIGAAINAVYREMWRRNSEDVSGEPITLVIDEFTTTMAKLPDVRDKVMDIWTMGRSANIRLITMAPEVSVKAWGIEGRGDVRENILFVECREDKSAFMYRWNKDKRAINTRDVPQLAAGNLDAARLWMPDAAQSGASVAPSVSRSDAPAHSERDEPALVARWLQADANVSAREIARRLHRARRELPPDAPIEYTGDGDLYYVARALLQEAREGVTA